MCDTQGSYVIGLDCGMFDGIYVQKAVDNLVRKIEEADYTIRTGFFWNRSDESNTYRIWTA